MQGWVRIMQRGIHFGTLDEEPLPTESSQMTGITLDALENSNQPSRTSAPSRHTSMTVEQAIGVSQLESKKLAREIVVPTDNGQVMEHLMLIGEPITLFGEGPYQRRERLKGLLVDKRLKAKLEDALAKLDEERKDQNMVTDKDEFFVPGNEELIGFRKWILNYSLARAADRLAGERQLRSGPLNQIKEGRLKINERFKAYKNYSSQVGCERPLSFGAFSPDGSLFATGGFGGSCKVWSTNDSQLRVELAGHPSRTNCVRFHPHLGSPNLATGLHLASSSDDCTIGLWNLESKEQIGSLKGHTARIPRFQFHPSGLCLGSVSFDYSWRLWDLERQTELQLQEGHTRPVYCIDFQQDGSLAGTGGLDSIGRIWDLRLGRSIWALTNEHVKGLLALKFSCTGYEIATASEDCTVRIWDLRALKVAYNLPAHTSTVSDLVWTPDGNGLITASYDGTAKIWDRHGWKLLSTLEGHGSKVMSVDISRSGLIGTTGYDRTFKFWQ